MLKPREDGGGALTVFHEDVLGDFEDQCLGGQRVPAEEPADAVRESRIGEVRGADVDGDGELDALVAPASALADRFFEHRSSEVPHQPARLRHLDEVARRQQAPRRMLPAHERFHTADHAAPEVELGLIDTTCSPLAMPARS